MDLNESSGRDLKTLIRSLKEKLLNRNVAVFSFFLMLSFIFWFINALSKDVSSSINYPVRFINFPENLALVNELPDKLVLEVEGPGYSVLKTRVSGNKAPLVIDVDNSGLAVKDSETGKEFYVFSFKLKESFTRQLRSDFEINEIIPDTLNFIFDKVISKKVPVKPDIEINVQRQFMVHGNIKSRPDSVIITGPKAVIDTITFVQTRHHLFDQLSSTVSRKVDLEPIRKISLSEKNVEITVPVEQFTEEIININIKVLNKPDTADVRLFPDDVTVHFNIALSDYDRVQESFFEAVVDVKNIDISKVEKLKVDMLSVPSFVSNVRYEPNQVEYIIEKK